ncbi:MAG: polyprenyl synthetase family protein [Bacteroidota bacterium]
MMDQFQQLIERCRNLIEQQLRVFMRKSPPKPRFVAEPVHYILAKRGKRIRPVLLLLACKAVDGRISDALPAGVAVELLHNFTLVHDDIMDNATSRRGRATVHTKWDQSTAILVGDELIALAYRSLLQAKSPRLRVILDTFTQAFVAVCEGQGLDKEFEAQQRVSLARYLTMIEQKTAKIISASAEIGALIGGGTAEQVRALRKYGLHLGCAFQVQDDLLDVVANESWFGKTVGADIASGKKTYLLVRALKKAKGSDRDLLIQLVHRNALIEPNVARIRSIYEKYGILAEARRTAKEETERGKRAIGMLPSQPGRAALNSFADLLLERNF